MDKTNQFRSSPFYMGEGDVLHLLIIDETGTAITVELSGGEISIKAAPGEVTAIDASDITSSGFTANWLFQENAEGYYFNLATDPDMTPHIAGYENLDVGNVNQVVITGLTSGVTYYYQISAYNDVGEGLESNIITTLLTSTLPLEDLDGNDYDTVIIGSQEWTVENLKVTKYADSSAITNLTTDADWYQLGTGTTSGYCWYDNDLSNKTPYGAIYNGFAVKDAKGLVYFTRGVVHETGWRIPSKADWQKLFDFVEADTVGGGRLKEVGLTHWDNPNTGAIDEFGFKAVGSGLRTYGGTFYQLKIHFNFWSDTVLPDYYAPGLNALYQSTVSYDSASITPEWCQEVFLTGMSIRCVRDIYIGTIYVTFTDPDNPTILWRKGVRSGQLRVDVTLTALGFSGVEDADWKNIKST
jgi:uncharacterized protein (TIGR02145 family)